MGSEIRAGQDMKAHAENRSGPGCGGQKMRYEETAFAYLNELIEHRRNLHRIPELGNQEVETKKYLLECLSRFQPDWLLLV